MRNKEKIHMVSVFLIVLLMALVTVSYSNQYWEKTVIAQSDFSEADSSVQESDDGSSINFIPVDFHCSDLEYRNDKVFDLQNGRKPLLSFIIWHPPKI